MSSYYKYKIIAACFFCFFFLIQHGSAQEFNFMCNTPIGDNISGYYEYLPEHYNADPTQKFPLIIFVNGFGANGTGSCDFDDDPRYSLISVLTNMPASPAARSYNNSPPQKLSPPYWPNSFTVNSQTFEFIITAPQFTIEPYYFPGASFEKKYGVEDIDAFIDYMIQNRRVDKERVYLTGQSSGAEYVLRYVGFSLGNAQKVAGVVSASPSGFLSQAEADIVSAGRVAIWLVASTYDKQYGDGGAVARITATADALNNATPAPTITPLVSEYPEPGNTHNSAAYRIFNQTIREAPGDLNVYEWMLQYHQGGALPVTGLNLHAVILDNSIRLQWTTYSEINTVSYTIEKSTDGNHFDSVGAVASHNLSKGSDYVFFANPPVSGANYFRIRQNDTDGQMTYSRIVSLYYNSTASNTVLVYPNPAKNTVSVNLNNSLAKASSVKIFDNTGRQVQHFVPAGERKIDINVSGLAKGYYFGKIMTSEGSTNFSFIKE